MRITDWISVRYERGMNRHDRQAWATASSLSGIGHLTVDWLYGKLQQTPAHCGPPEPETIPHLDVLAAANRAGFVTTNSQSASSPEDTERYGDEWGADVQGLVGEEALERLRAAIAGTGLLIAGARRRVWFGSERGRWLRSCWRDDVGFYCGRCPAAAEEIASAWWVTITDPEPGTNDRLWPALAAFAEPAPSPLPVARSRTRRHGEGSTTATGGTQ